MDKQGPPTLAECALYLQLVDAAFDLLKPRVGTGSYNLAKQIKDVVARFDPTKDDYKPNTRAASGIYLDNPYR